MKILILLFGLFCALESISQENGIYLSANDFKRKKLSLSFDKKTKITTPFWHSHQIWVKTKDSVYKFYCDEIWGYKSDKVDWRLFNGEAYQVKYAGKICLYEVPVYSPTGSYHQDYFSDGLYSPIKTITRSHLLEVYHANKIFADKMKSRGWYKEAFEWNKKLGQYVCEGWL